MSEQRDDAQKPAGIGDAMGRVLYGDEWDAVKQRQQAAVEAAAQQLEHERATARRKQRAEVIGWWIGVALIGVVTLIALLVLVKLAVIFAGL